MNEWLGTRTADDQEQRINIECWIDEIAQQQHTHSTTEELIQLLRGGPKSEVNQFQFVQQHNLIVSHCAAYVRPLRRRAVQYRFDERFHQEIQNVHVEYRMHTSDGRGRLQQIQYDADIHFTIENVRDQVRAEIDRVRQQNEQHFQANLFE